VTPDLRAELARHQPHGFADDPVCEVCAKRWPCDASRAIAALDAAEQERDEAKSQVATLVEALRKLHDQVNREQDIPCVGIAGGCRIAVILADLAPAAAARDAAMVANAIREGGWVAAVQADAVAEALTEERVREAVESCFDFPVSLSWTVLTDRLRAALLASPVAPGDRAVSADNWAMCPRCLTKASPSGSTTPEDYRTFREDYEIGVNDDASCPDFGKVTVIYHGECQTCRLQVHIKELHRIPDWPAPSPEKTSRPFRVAKETEHERA